MTAPVDFWNSIPAPTLLDCEANVESRLVLPLLHELGYSDVDIESKYPVEFQQGRLGRKHEADFVCFYGPLHDKTNSLLVVEAKNASEPLSNGKEQGESYAQNLRAPLLLLTNGRQLEIWQMQISHDSERVLQISVSDLVQNRGTIERFLNKIAVRDYCASLQFKTIVEATTDFGAYETAELTRLNADPDSIARTLRQHEIGGNGSDIASNSLISDYPSGACIFAPSGYGKTTLSRSLFKQAIEERWRDPSRAIAFEAPLPDLEETGEDFLSFLHQRLRAHNPGVTLENFKDTLRAIGATVVCDSLDRTTHEFRKRMISSISLFQRDYPLSQVFICSRADTKPSLTLPTLDLCPLSVQEVRELENIILSDGQAKHWSVIGSASPILRSLCDNPLILRLALDYWKYHREFPRDVDHLFRAWLETILETEPNDLVSRRIRESALTVIAEATTNGPLSSVKAIELLKNNGIAGMVLNELVNCNALHETNAALEIQHDGLADYLRAKAFSAQDVPAQLAAIPTLKFSGGSFLPVLLMAQLSAHDAQEALWQNLVTGKIDTYMDALRYRFDTSDELVHLERSELSRRYLTDLLNGIDEPLDGFFPEVRPAIVDGLTGQRDGPLSIIGRASLHDLSYKIASQRDGEPRVAVGVPEFPGTIRGVNLDQARYRSDSARLLGVSLLKNELESAVKSLDVSGGKLWASERLTARVRLLAHRYGENLSVDSSLDHIEKVLAPHSQKRIDDGFVGEERFAIRSMLDDVATLRKAGLTELDPWWLRLGWNDDVSLMSDEQLSQVLNEEYRRVQLVYAEIIQASFPRFADDLIYFPILPLRWKLTVVRKSAFGRAFTVLPHWTPVADWKDAGADVLFADRSTPNYPDWKVVEGALAALGRPINIPHYGGFTTHFGFDGSIPNGRFRGTSPVANEVMSWLKDDLKRLFRNLPPADGAFAV
jgi:hypothetical protein